MGLWHLWPPHSLFPFFATAYLTSWVERLEQRMQDTSGWGQFFMFRIVCYLLISQQNPTHYSRSSLSPILSSQVT